jgi:hypothetical protein
VVGTALAGSCQPGTFLSFDCGPARDLVLAVITLGAVLYVGLLTLVVAWTSRMSRRPGAEAVSGRDWYLVAAVVGVVIAPLLAFTILAALGWLG